MKLVELVSFFRRGGTFEKFCYEHQLDPESEVIEIYALVPLKIDSELAFFPIEETGGKITHFVGGHEYQNLFDFYYFLDVINELGDEPAHLDVEVSDRLFEYAIHDR